MNAWVGRARAAIALTTRIPVGDAPFTPEDRQWAPALSPAVGAMVGFGGAVLFVLLTPVGPPAAALLALAATVVVTGALYEHGLADTFDALGTDGDAARRSEIVKDGRIGPFGAMALVFSIVTRAMLIAKLGGGALVLWPLASAWARVGPVWQLLVLPHATPTETSKSISLTSIERPQALSATGIGAAFALLAIAFDRLSLERALFTAIVGAGVTWFSSWRARVDFGGITGHLLGASEQLGEIALLSVLAWPNG